MAKGTSETQNDSNRTGSICLSMAMERRHLWENGRSLYVAFLGGNRDIHEVVKECAEEWTKYANIKFIFEGKEHPEIRISFDQRGRWYSVVGKAALELPLEKPTMNLAFPCDNDPTRLRHLVLHEFGHALGCIHEHCSPAATIPWSKEKVYSYYDERAGWDKQMVDDNIFHQYSLEATMASAFDPRSIMMYHIPSSLTNGALSNSDNFELSSIDKEFIAKVYPKEGNGANIFVSMAAPSRLRRVRTH